MIAAALVLHPLLAVADPAPKTAEPSRWTDLTGKNCKVWNKAPQPMETVTWTGSCVDGYASGPGTMQWYQGGKPTEDDTATLVAGKSQGECRSNYANGNTYDGQCGGPDGSRNGFGTMHFFAGGSFTGAWDDGEFVRGIRVYATGTTYEGSFQHGKPSGKGTLKYANGAIYNGQFDDGKPNGKGEKVSASGERESGDFVNGMLSGDGIDVGPTGWSYVGQFQDGKPNGRGTLTSPQGWKYTGDFIKGVPAKSGRVHFLKADGTTFDGDIKDFIAQNRSGGKTATLEVHPAN